MFFILVMIILTLVLIHLIRYHHLKQSFETQWNRSLVSERPLLWRLWCHGWSSFPHNFLLHVQDGRSTARDSSLVCAGMIHHHFENVQPFLDRTILPLLISSFATFHIVFLVNGDDTASHDTATSWALDWNRKLGPPTRITILAPDHLPSTSRLPKKDDQEALLERVHIMRDLRQYLWTYLARHFSDRDLLWLMDPDLTGHMPVEGFFHALHNLRSHPSWYAIGCNTITPDLRIFDTFPLVPLHSSFHWIQSQAKQQHDAYIQRQLQRPLLWTRIEILPVWSTFNGSMLYQINNIFDPVTEQPRFDYSFDQETIICEHTMLHLNFPSGSVALDPLWFFYLEKNWN